MSDVSCRAPAPVMSSLGLGPDLGLGTSGRWDLGLGTTGEWTMVGSWDLGPRANARAWDPGRWRVASGFGARGGRRPEGLMKYDL